MRTTIIPAQITTVEDRIAGNFNLTQIGLLIMAVFLSTGIFTILPPINQLAIYKLVAIGLTCFICLTLSLRIKGKVMLNWLVIMGKFYQRPRYYLFNKNDNYLRDLVFDEIETLNEVVNKEENKAEAISLKPEIKMSDVIQIEQLLSGQEKAIRFKVTKGGGLNVAIE